MTKHNLGIMTIPVGLINSVEYIYKGIISYDKKEITHRPAMLMSCGTHQLHPDPEFRSMGLLSASCPCPVHKRGAIKLWPAHFSTGHRGFHK